MSSTTTAPPFSLDQPRFDLNSFLGRVLHFTQMIDPRMLYASEGEIQRCQGLLEQFKDKPEKTREAVGDDQLWRARKVIEASVHPYTKEQIFPLFRMAAFAPVNIPIVYGMLTASTTPQMLFIHWINQSYNTAVNYSNRSGAAVDTKQILESYALAVVTSCSMAAGLGKLVEKGYLGALKGSPAVVSYFSVGAAGAANIIFSRKNELVDGAPMSDASGKMYGNSVIAGKSVVMQTALSRGLFIPMPVLLLPPALMAGLNKLKLVPSQPRLKLGVELVVITASLMVALPPAMAMFPQKAQFQAQDLEPQFHDLYDKVTGKRIDTLYTNKGL